MRNRIRCDRTVKVRWGQERKDKGKIWQGGKEGRASHWNIKKGGRRKGGTGKRSRKVRWDNERKEQGKMWKGKEGGEYNETRKEIEMEHGAWKGAYRNILGRKRRKTARWDMEVGKRVRWRKEKGRAG
jgi:hypothetical protein